MKHATGHRIETAEYRGITVFRSCDQSAIEGPLTAMAARPGMPGQERDDPLYQRLGLFRIGEQNRDDHIHGDGVVTGMPAIIVGHHRNRRIADLGLAGELRLGHVGHPDHVATPRAVELALCKARELRPLHNRRA